MLWLFLVYIYSNYSNYIFVICYECAMYHAVSISIKHRTIPRMHEGSLTCEWPANELIAELET